MIMSEIERFQPDRDLIWVPKDYPQKIDTWIDKHPFIVFMGCSCTELGTYDRCLKSLVDQNHPTNVFQYVNMGVSGWSSYQGLQQLKRDVPRIRPQIDYQLPDHPYKTYADMTPRGDGVWSFAVAEPEWKRAVGRTFMLKVRLVDRVGREVEPPVEHEIPTGLPPERRP